MRSCLLQGIEDLIQRQRMEDLVWRQGMVELE
jgi:hypothetical protein